MSIHPENYISRAQFLENIVIEDLKKATDDRALSAFFQDACCVSGLITVASLLFPYKNITLLCGLTTTLTLLANSYFAEKVTSKVMIANILNKEVQELKKLTKIRNEEKSLDQTDSLNPHTSLLIPRDNEPMDKQNTKTD